MRERYIQIVKEYLMVRSNPDEWEDVLRNLRTLGTTEEEIEAGWQQWKRKSSASAEGSTQQRFSTLHHRSGSTASLLKTLVIGGGLGVACMFVYAVILFLPGGQGLIRAARAGPGTIVSLVKEGESGIASLFAGVSALPAQLFPASGKQQAFAAADQESVAGQPNGRGILAADTALHRDSASQQSSSTKQATQGPSLNSLPTNTMNLLRNSSFEERTGTGEPTDWSYQLDSTAGNTFLSQEGNRSGVFGLKFLGGETGNFGVSQPDTKTVPGRTYTFSLYMKTTNAPAGTLLRFGFWNEDLNQEGAMKVVSLPATEDWTRYVFTVTTPGQITDPKNEFPLIEVEGLTSGAVYLDDAELTEGSIPVVYNSAQAYNSSYGVGDGSLLFSPGGDIYPAYAGIGKLGTSTNQFSALNLTNASIDTDGNLTLKGGGIVSGGLSVGGLTVNGTTLFSSIINSLQVGSGGTGQTSFTPNGILYGNGTSGLLTLAPGTVGYILQTNGTGAAPSWVPATSIGAAFSSLVGGTNTSAAMVVGSGASLNFSGAGTINASTLLGNTWAMLGAIGSTTPTTGAFTLLTTTGTVGIGTTTPGNPLQLVTGNTNDVASISSTLSSGTLRSMDIVDGSMSTGQMNLYNIGHDLGAGGNNYGVAYFGFDYQGLNSTNNFATIGLWGKDNIVNITGAGNMGIGTTTPKNVLDIVGSEAVGSYAGSNPAPSNSLIVSGNVGIGTNNPTSPLYVNGSGNDMVVLNSTLNSGFIRPFEMLDSSMTSGQNLVYHVGHDLSTNNSGYIGFHYTGSASPENWLTLGFWGNDNVYNFTPSGHVGFGTTLMGNDALVINQQESGDIFSASKSGSTMFVISNTGNVGIGTTTPGQKLTIQTATSNYGWMQTDGTGQLASWLGNSSGCGSVECGEIGTITNHPLAFFTNNNSPSVVLSTGGNVGIGNSIPLTALDITGSASESGNTSFRGSGTAHQINLLQNGTLGIYNSVGGDTGLGANPALFIADNGDIGAGTVSPAGQVDISQLGNPGSLLRLDATNSNPWSLVFNRNDVGGSKYLLWDDNAGGLQFCNNGDNTCSGLTQNGFMAIGGSGNTLSPKATLDVRAATLNSGSNGGTIAIASISGQTSFASLVVDNAGKGDLFTASSSGLSRFVITQNGNVGIGTTTPSTTLNVVGSLCVKNSTASCAGALAGTIYASNTTVQSADMAENYISSESLEPGDVIMPANDGNNQAVIKTTSAYQSQAIGVVSTNPGVTLNSDAAPDSMHPHTYPIALQGRVPVKVSSVNGNIQAGDLLTTSSFPGVAMKATQAGQSIGKALESYASSDPNAVGRIMVFVNISWGNPAVSLTADGNLAVSGEPIGGSVTGAITPVLLPTMQSLTGGAAADQFTSLSTTVAELQDQVASIGAQVGKIADLGAQLVDVQKPINLNQLLQSTATQSAVLGAATTPSDMTIGGTLSVEGRTVLSDLGITGVLSTGLLTINGLDTSHASARATINTLSGPLMLQSLAINGVDFFNGKVTIDTHGTLVTTGSITAKTLHADEADLGRLTMTNSPDAPSVGEATIPAGATQVVVKTAAVSSTSHIFTSPEEAIDFPLGILKKQAGVSFTVGVTRPVPQDTKFSWWIVNDGEGMPLSPPPTK